MYGMLKSYGAQNMGKQKHKKNGAQTVQKRRARIQNSQASIHVSFSFLGCPECYPKRDTLNPGADNKPMEELYQNTQRKIKYLKDQGFEVVEKWGCTFKKELKQDEELKQFVKDHGFIEPLQPRDAFFGGRTNAAKLLHECQGDEKIK